MKTLPNSTLKVGSGKSEHEMEYQFTDQLPGHIDHAPVLISAEVDTPYSTYLLLDDCKAYPPYEFRHPEHTGPFMEALIEDKLLAAGLHTRFYLYNLSQQKTLLQLPMKGYFGHVYCHDNHFYVADAEGLFKVDLNGQVVWSNANLGIDGVIISTFSSNQITGEGEWDPPGGWRAFTLNIETGQKE